MNHTVTVKSANGRAAGWIVEYARYTGPNDELVFIPIEWAVDDDGNFTSTLPLDDGNWCLACQLAFAGTAVEIDLDPPAPIVDPPNEEWPVTVKVPPARTQELVTIYFRVGR